MHGLTGKYRLDARLGGGGMAEVFVGSTVGAEGFSRRVAIKRILPGFSENPAFAQMFVEEAQISAKLQHPNIVSVLDFDRDADGRLFLVMELVEGKDLDDLVSTGPLPFSVVIHVFAEILRGLGYAHNLPTAGAAPGAMRGLVHRDVSPHNVLVSWEGAIKVSDFGIAKARSASNATASMFIKGKPQYMSPEQANGQPLDGRSDLFAVGVMLWEMLTGQRLFVGNTTQEVLARMLFAPIAWPRQLRPEVPIDLERIAMRLLERNLVARYLTAEDVVSDLLAAKHAPRGGRDELVAVMADRFPGLAPERPIRRPGPPERDADDNPPDGVRSIGSGGHSAPVASAWVGVPSAGHTAPTVRALAQPEPGVVFQAASAPIASTGMAAPPGREGSGPAAAMAAETRTIGPGATRPPARIPLAVWIVVGAVVALLITLIVVVATGPGPSPPTTTAAAAPDGPSAPRGAAGAGPADAMAGTAGGPAAGTTAGTATGTGGGTAGTAADPASAPIDASRAGRADARVMLPPADAARAITPRSITPRSLDARAAAGCTFDRGGKATGSVEITAEPWAVVTIDGAAAGQTPVVKKLLVGCHVITLANPDLDKSARRKVVVEPGATEVVSVDWR